MVSVGSFSMIACKPVAAFRCNESNFFLLQVLYTQWHAKVQFELTINIEGNSFHVQRSDEDAIHTTAVIQSRPSKGDPYPKWSHVGVKMTSIGLLHYL